MRNTTKRAYVLFAMILAFFVGLGILAVQFALHGEAWATSTLNGHLNHQDTRKSGVIYDSKGRVVLTVDGSDWTWNESRSLRTAMVHTVGDKEGGISASLLNCVKSQGAIGTHYSLLQGLYPVAQPVGTQDLHLTVDAKVNETALQAIKDCKSHKGTILAYNYKTGDVYCLASAPSFDPANLPKDILTNSAYEGAYLNRAFASTFTPGSTFKIVTLICALQNLPDVESRTFQCKGSYKGVTCNGTHGKLTLEGALNHSCNSVFAELAMELGAEKLTETVEQLGFFDPVSVSGIRTKASTFTLKDAAKNSVGWAGIGQYETRVNPCQMLMLCGAIANNGKAVTPRLLDDESAAVTNKNIHLSASLAEKVRELLRSNVVNYYGTGKFPNLQLCGKTGTAQVGNSGKSHAWFVGFSMRDDFPVAIVVCLEEGGTGYYHAIPAANRVLQALLKAGI